MSHILQVQNKTKTSHQSDVIILVVGKCLNHCDMAGADSLKSWVHLLNTIFYAVLCQRILSKRVTGAGRHRYDIQK